MEGSLAKPYLGAGESSRAGKQESGLLEFSGMEVVLPCRLWGLLGKGHMGGERKARQGE